KMPNTLTY
ncbi:hypothetical protein D050_1913B, partial [Vibrio parahaemolyticus VPCR-2009]